MDLSPEDLNTAKTKIRAAWKSANPDKDDDEMPEGIHEASEPRVTAADDPEAKPSRDYLTALWGKIKELAGSAISRDDFDAAHRSAMSSAGGKATAKKRAESKADAASLTESDALWFAEQQPNGFLVALWLQPGIAEQLALASGEPAESLHVTLCYCGDVTDLDELTIARAITAVDREVSYRGPIEGLVSGYGRFTASPSSDARDVFYASIDAPDLTHLRQCIADALTYAGCPPRTNHGYTPHLTLAYLDPGDANPVDDVPSLPLRFSAVTIMIGPKRIDIPLGGFGPTIYSTADKATGTWKLFVEQSRMFAEAPEWINVLPVPGEYIHPSYGSITITPERNQRFKDNFDNEVYQKNIPITIDIEHDGKMSGAVGYFVELRINDDGSLDARVTWSDLGRELIEADAFKYFSPEWWEYWTPPRGTVTYQDVLIGGAICVRPFFKEDVLAPLVASEGHLYVPESRDGGQSVIVLRPLAAVQAKEESGVVVQLTEEEVQKFREAEARVATLETQLATQTEEKKATDEKVAALETEAQHKRFTDLVMGRGEAGDGAVFVGGIKENVDSLVTLAEALGEDSEQFQAEVALRQATAKTLKESAAFRPIGTSEGGEGGDSAWGQIEAKATALATEKSITFAEAVGQVAENDPQLYADYEQERTGR